MMKKRIFIIVFSLIVAGALIFAIRYANSPLGDVMVKEITQEESISTQGLIVRNENVYRATADGTIYNNVTEGKRVSKDSLVSTIYSGAVSSDILKELTTLDKKIAGQISEDSKSSLYQSDSSSVESEILTRVNAIYSAAKDNNFAKVAQYKEEINKLRAGEEITGSDKLNELRSEKQKIEDRIGANKNEIFADISGTFTTYLDGLEAVLTPDKVKEYTPEYIDSLKEKVKNSGDSPKTSRSTVKTGDSICKVVNNHVWYVLVESDKDTMSKYKVNSDLSVRFRNMANEEIEGTISYISDPQPDNRVLVMITCRTYFEGAFSYRMADCDLIFKSYKGYKVPIQAVHTDGSQKSVMGTSGNKQYSCACEVIYTDTTDNYVIIRSTDDAVNKISKMDKIVVSEK